VLLDPIRCPVRGLLPQILFTRNCPELKLSLHSLLLIWDWLPNQRQSKSQSYVTTNGQSASLFWCQAPIWGLRLDFYDCQTVAGVLMWSTLSDERTGLPFTIAASPRQRSHSWGRVPRDSWPYFTLSDSRLPQPGGPGPRIYITQEKGGPVIPQGTGFPFCRLLRLAGLRWRYSNPPPSVVVLIHWRQSRSHIATDGQSISKSWCRTPSDIYYSLTGTVLFFWGTLSDERTGLSFFYAAGPRQRSLFRVRVPWDSWQYLLSQIRVFPFRRLLRLAGLRWRYWNPPPRRVVLTHWSESKSHIVTDGQSISKSWCRAPSGAHDQIQVFITLWQLRSCFPGAPSLTRGLVCLLYMLLALASVVFLGPSPLGLVTIFYCLRFETSHFVASYDSQGHGGSIRTRLHTGGSWILAESR
jgi:hypothetical protein